MSWSDWFGAERSDGESNTVTDVNVSIKSDNSSAEVTDVLVSNAETGSKETHDHYYNVDKDVSGVVERIEWGLTEDDD
jgi:hypothetical protein